MTQQIHATLQILLCRHKTTRTVSSKSLPLWTSPAIRLHNSARVHVCLAATLITAIRLQYLVPGQRSHSQVPSLPELHHPAQTPPWTNRLPCLVPHKGFQTRLVRKWRKIKWRKGKIKSVDLGFKYFSQLEGPMTPKRKSWHKEAEVCYFSKNISPSAISCGFLVFFFPSCSATAW